VVAPTKFTPETVHTLLSGIRAGLPYRLAAEAAGISETTFTEWQAGRLPRGADRALKASFPGQLTRARGESALRLSGLISRAATDDWRAAAWLLERRFPKDFTRDASLYERLDALETALAGDTAPTPLRKVG
jgi:hypothetical protein